MTVQMRLTGDDGHGRLRKFQLDYVGVTSFKSIAEHEKGLPGPQGYGDLGYEEIDVVDGLFVHGILFSGGIEFEIRFKGFELSYDDDG